MKNAKWVLPVTLMLLSGLMAAQSLSGSSVVAKVPFDFMVSNKMIPAGDCVIKAVTMDGLTLAVRNFDAGKSTLARSRQESGNAADSTVLVFKHYGDSYFLSSVRIAGSNVTYELPESRAEAELRAQNAPASQLTLLASVR